jgi:hypothetical protein
MSFLNRVLLAAAVSWTFSVTLGLLFAAYASGNFSPHTLRLPGVVPVAVIVSTVVSAVVTPLTVWALRTGAKNICVYGPILWIALAAYEVVVVPRTGLFGLSGLLVLSLGGLTILGLIPSAKPEGDSQGSVTL